MPRLVEASRVVPRSLTLDYSDFAGAAQSRTIDVDVPVPANCQLLSFSLDCTTAPAGGGCVSCDVMAGDGVDSAGYCTQEDHLALGVGVYQAYGAYIVTGSGFSNAARQIRMTITVDGAHTTNDLTQGVWRVRYAYVQLVD